MNLSAANLLSSSQIGFDTNLTQLGASREPREFSATIERLSEKAAQPAKRVTNNHDRPASSDRSEHSRPQRTERRTQNEARDPVKSEATTKAEGLKAKTEAVREQIRTGKFGEENKLCATIAADKVMKALDALIAVSEAVDAQTIETPETPEQAAGLGVLAEVAGVDAAVPAKAEVAAPLSEIEVIVDALANGVSSEPASTAGEAGDVVRTLNRLTSMVHDRTAVLSEQVRPDAGPEDADMAPSAALKAAVAGRGAEGSEQSVQGQFADETPGIKERLSDGTPEDRPAARTGVIPSFGTTPDFSSGQQQFADRQSAQPLQSQNAAPAGVLRADTSFADRLQSAATERPAGSQQTHSPETAKQIISQITKVAANGRLIVVNLHPSELGRVEVSMSTEQDGDLRTVIRAENPMTLETLRAERTMLANALRDAGYIIDANSIEFQEQSASGSRDSNSGGHGRSDNGQGDQPEDSASSEQQDVTKGGVIYRSATDLLA